MKLAADHRPDTVHIADIAEMHTTEVITVGIAAFQQLGIAIAAVAVARDDDESHTQALRRFDL